ncbi:M4 family metallopeptidase [Shewanella waksmanii]|uniref:M4 family metallopeptidase n=1 Tax=Shewanella waksmanii TaxID=213783 RepID=UPI0037350663
MFTTATKLTLCSLAVSTLLAGHAAAAQRIDMQQPNLLSTNQLTTQSVLSATSGTTYQAKTVSTDIDGNERARYQQLYQGVPVFGASIVATRSPMNQFYNPVGYHIAKIDSDVISTSPSFSLDEALHVALSDNADKETVYNIESQLYIWLDEKDQAYLAWLISYVDSDGQAPSRPYQVIDAHSGKLLDSWDGMTFAQATGPGGNQRTGRYQFGDRYPAFEVTGSGSSCRLDSTNVETYDMNHRTSGGSIHTFPCYENTSREVNGSYSALNDAHAFGQVTFNMYRDWYNKAPITQKLRMRVHYDRNYENAFWDGQQMTFGDGQNTFHPLVGLGVVAHEVSHGFTQQNSNLVYRNQSGGLNESFSDIAAAAATYYLEGSFSWQIGDRIKKGSGAMRYMDNPPLDGRSIGHTRDYYSGIDVHLSSGVYNKAFYLLSTTSGWTIREAFDIYVKANQLYWNANATFESAGRGVYNATKDLGYCVDDVVASLEAVGVTGSGAKDGSGCGPVGNQPPNADFSYSASQLVVSFTDLSTDDKGVVSHQWQFGDGMTSSQQNPTHTYASAGSYAVSLTVSDAEGKSDTHSVTVTVSTDPDVPDQCNGLAPWDVAKSYNLGDKVSFEGYEYEAIWWSTGASPAIYTNVWSKGAKCSGGDLPNQGPNASFNHSANKLVVSFNNTSTDDKGIVGHTWNFGDGNSSNQVSPTHTYAAAGSYSVQLTVVDADDASDTVTQTVTVTTTDTPDECNAAPWDPAAVYVSGDLVSQNGNEYRAKWWNQNESPADSGQWGVWEFIAQCQ